jgi:hypothetical protein
MGNIVVRRERSGFNDLLRDYAVAVDGVVLAQIPNGGQCTLELSPGVHQVQMKIDWCTSPVLEVSVPAAGSVLLDCGPGGSPLLALLYISIWRKKYLWLRNSQVP